MDSLPRLFNDDRWQECLESYLTMMFDKSGSTQTLTSYKRVLYTFFSTSATGEPKQPTDYNRQDVIAFLQLESQSSRNKGAPVGPASRNNRLAVLNSFYKYASSYTIPGDDGQPVALLQRIPPCAGLSYARPPVTYRALSESELTLFFAQIPNHTVAGVRDRAIFTMLLLTARRIGEVVSLNWGSISAGPPIMFTFYPKGHSREQRVQELPQECYSLLLRYLHISNRLQDIRPDSPLFVGLPPRHGGNYRNVGRRLSIHYVNDAVKTYSRKAGLPHLERLSSHSFRHSSARLAYSSGADIRAIQMKLGHSSLASTDTYLRVLAGERDSTLPLLRARLTSILE